MTKVSSDWKSALLPDGATLQCAVDIINRTGLQIALVIDPSSRLVGTVTDGDIRRPLLRGLGLDAPLDGVMNPSPMVVTPDMGRDLVMGLMRANRIHQLPVVESERRVVGLHVWDDVVVPARRRNTMVLMAGGFGRRLRPFTDDCPKPMLPVAGRPILEHIIERGCVEGFTNFVISVHYLGDVIRNHFGDGSRWGVDISYLQEKEPLGTAGAITLLDPIPITPFIVANGDVLSNVKFGEVLDFHREHKADATMAVRQHEWQHPFGVVRTEGTRIVALEEKPIIRTYVNAGIYAVEPSALALLAKGQHCDMPKLFEMLKEAGKATIAYPMHEPWLDVGRAEDLDRANRTQ